MIEYLLAGALTYRTPLSAITNRLEPRNKRIVRLDRGLNRNIVRRSEANGRLDDRPPLSGGGGGYAPDPASQNQKKIRPIGEKL